MEIKVVNKSKYPLPEYATKGSAALDLYANIEDTIMIGPHESKLIPTGLFMEIPEGVLGFVLPRSGNALKSGLMVANAPGLIDSDYRGEVGVILHNSTNWPVHIFAGNKIAQFLVLTYQPISWRECSMLSETERGAGGFGHTDKN